MSGLENLKQTQLEVFYKSLHKKKANNEPTKKSKSKSKNVSSIKFYNDRLCEKIAEIKKKKRTTVDKDTCETIEDRKSSSEKSVSEDVVDNDKQTNDDDDDDFRETQDVCVNILCENQVSAQICR